MGTDVRSLTDVESRYQCRWMAPRVASQQDLVAESNAASPPPQHTYEDEDIGALLSRPLS
jgi:hypothetical protein